MDTEKTAQPFDPASFEHVPVLLNECLDGLKIDRRAPIWTARRAARGTPARSPCG
mgnify:FL=1